MVGLWSIDEVVDGPYCSRVGIYRPVVSVLYDSAVV